MSYNTLKDLFLEKVKRQTKLKPKDLVWTDICKHLKKEGFIWVDNNSTCFRSHDDCEDITFSRCQKKLIGYTEENYLVIVYIVKGFIGIDIDDPNNPNYGYINKENFSFGYEDEYEFLERYNSLVQYIDRLAE